MTFLSRVFRKGSSPESGGGTKVCLACSVHNPGDARFCNGCGLEFKRPLARYDAFVSYRRDGGKDVATIIRLSLEKFDKTVFMDVDELQTGRFDEKLLDAIARSDSFILVLSPGCLDRCVQKSDWLKREVMHALQLDKCIIPVMLTGFQFPSESFIKQLPDLMEVLPTLNAVSYDHVARDAAIRKILDFMAHPTAPFSGTPNVAQNEAPPGEARYSRAVADEKVRSASGDAALSLEMRAGQTGAPRPDVTIESGVLSSESDSEAEAGMYLSSSPSQASSAAPTDSDTHKVIRSLLRTVSITTSGFGCRDNRAEVFNEIMMRCDDDDQVTFQRIEALLQDEDHAIADAAAMVLIKQQPVPSLQTVERLTKIIRGASHPLLARDLGNAWQHNMRYWAAESHEIVLRALKFASLYHASQVVRHEAIEALSRVGTKEAVEVVAEIILRKRQHLGDAVPNKDWDTAIRSLTDSKSGEASLGVVNLCRQANDPEILRCLAYWVKCHFRPDSLTDENRKAILACMQGILLNPGIDDLGRRAALTVVMNLDPKSALVILEEELPKGNRGFEEMMLQAIDEAFAGREPFLRLLLKSPHCPRIRERMLSIAGDPASRAALVAIAEKLARQLEVRTVT